MGWQELARKKKTGANGFSVYKRINNVDDNGRKGGIVRMWPDVNTSL